MIKNSFFAAYCLVAGFLVTSCSFSRKSQQKLLVQAKQHAPYDIIVVPGIAFNNGVWDRTMKGRIYWAKYLYEQGITRNIMFSGNAVHTAFGEAQVMALYAEALGIPRQNIYLEMKAEHSTENIYYGYWLARREGFSKIALASDPFQTKMLRSFTRKKISAEVGFIPLVVDTLKTLEPLMTDPPINYQAAYTENFIPLKKRDSFFKRMRGTLKGNFDTTAYR